MSRALFPAIAAQTTPTTADAWRITASPIRFQTKPCSLRRGTNRLQGRASKTTNRMKSPPSLQRLAEGFAMSTVAPPISVQTRSVLSPSAVSAILAPLSRWCASISSLWVRGLAVLGRPSGTIRSAMPASPPHGSLLLGPRFGRDATAGWDVECASAAGRGYGTGLRLLRGWSCGLRRGLRPRRR
jgi:hypothetical protein